MRIFTAFGNCLVLLALAMRTGIPAVFRGRAAAEAGTQEQCERLIPRLPQAAIVYRQVADMKGPLAQSIDWRIMPVVNPDGFLAKKTSHMNASSVDLNRNFSTPGWETEAPRYWQVRTRADPSHFLGMALLSEPESRWVQDEMHGFRPDVIIFVNVPFGVLDFDGPAQPPHRFGRVMLNRFGIYPGSLGNQGGVHRKVPVITIELRNAQQMMSQAEVRRILVDMARWIADKVRASFEKDVQAADASAISAGDGFWTCFRLK